MFNRNQEEGECFLEELTEMLSEMEVLFRHENEVSLVLGQKDPSCSLLSLQRRRDSVALFPLHVKRTAFLLYLFLFFKTYYHTGLLQNCS